MAYIDIQNTFLDRFKRRDCTTAQTQGFIQDAIKRIQRILKVPGNEKQIAIVLNSSNYFNFGGLQIPGDFLRIKDITYISAISGIHQVLKRAPIAEVYGAIDYGVTGIVLKYARVVNLWVFGSLPLAGDTVLVNYFSEWQPSLVNNTDDNLLIDIADDLVVYGALSYACDHWADKRGPMFEQRFLQIISDIQMQGDVDETSGDAAVGQTFYYPPDHL